MEVTGCRVSGLSLERELAIVVLCASTPQQSLGGWGRWWWVVGGCGCGCVDCKLFVSVIDLCGEQCQVESLAGAAHLPVDNGCVLRFAEKEQKSQ